MSGLRKKSRKRIAVKTVETVRASAEYEEMRDAIVAKDVAALSAALEKFGSECYLDAVDDDLCTLLGWTIKADFLEGMEILLAKGANPDSTYRDNSNYASELETPLQIVANQSSKTITVLTNPLEMAQCLIRYGANPNLPLWWAIQNCDLPMVKLLLDGEADPFICRFFLRENLPTAMANALRLVAEYQYQLHYLSLGRHEEVFNVIWKTVFQKGWTSRSVDRHRNSTLHLAAKAGLQSVVLTILNTCSCPKSDSGPPLIFNKNNETPLVVAISKLDVKTVDLLLRLSMQPHPRGSYTSTSGEQVTINPNAFQSPLFRAFRVVLDDGRLENDSILGGAEVNSLFGFDADDLREVRNEKYRRLCVAIADSGYPLKEEAWLAHSFDDLRLGPNGPIEFRDVVWEKIPEKFLDSARETFDSLRAMRTNPLSLKSLTRLSIRRSLMGGSPCVVCRADRAGCPSGQGKEALEEVLGLIGLPEILRKFVSFDGWQVAPDIERPRIMGSIT